MLIDFFKESAKVIESLSDFEDLCKVIARRIEDVHSKATVF